MRPWEGAGSGVVGSFAVVECAVGFVEVKVVRPRRSPLARCPSCGRCTFDISGTPPRWAPAEGPALVWLVGQLGPVGRGGPGTGSGPDLSGTGYALRACCLPTARDGGVVDVAHW